MNGLGINFYQMAIDMLGTLPTGFEFVYVLVTIAIFILAMFVFLVLPLSLIFKGGRL